MAAPADAAFRRGKMQFFCSCEMRRPKSADRAFCDLRQQPRPIANDASEVPRSRVRCSPESTTSGSVEGRPESNAAFNEALKGSDAGRHWHPRMLRDGVLKFLWFLFPACDSRDSSPQTSIADVFEVLPLRS